MSLVNSIFEIKASISYPYNSSAIWTAGGQILDSNNNVIGSFSEIILTRDSISHSGGSACGGGGLGSVWGPYTTYNYYIKFGSAVWSQKDLSSSSSHNALTGPGVTRIKITSDNSGSVLADWLANNATKVNTEVDLTQYVTLPLGPHYFVAKSKATGYYTSAASNQVEYIKYQALQAPQTSLSQDTLVIEDVDNAVSYDIYDGNNLIANVPVGGVPSSGYSVSLNLTAYAIGYGQETYYATYVKVYDGTDNTGTLLASDVSSSTPTSANKSQVQETVTCQTGNLFIEWYVEWADYGMGDGSLLPGSSNCSITHSSGDAEHYATAIAITGDNAVVIMDVQGGLD